jgi:dTDP-4-amino-4,6-dideoxygalactose transaminase
LSRFRLVAPAGAPLPARSVLPLVFRSVGDDRGLAELLATRLGVRNPFFVSSGRAALAILLKVLRQGSDRREVVIPAYTCFSVPSAVARAGLTIRLCDVDPKTLDLDLNALVRLDLGKALCIVPSGLYGLPGDLVALEQIARTSGAFLVDDAAQCLGAIKEGRACGSFGDAGFYSLGRGKGITTMGGGILVTHRPDLAQRIAGMVRDLRRPSTWAVGVAVAGALAYSAMLRPSRYWLLDHVPFLELGASRFEPDFPIARLSAYQTRLAARLFPRLDSYNEIRRHNADQLRSGIEGVEGIEIPRPGERTSPVYLRFPILARDAAHRSHLLRRLREAGIGASASYPTAIGDIPGIESYLARHQEAYPGARAIGARILTLPTHPGVTLRDIEMMVTIIRGDQGRASEALR